MTPSRLAAAVTPPMTGTNAGLDLAHGAATNPPTAKAPLPAAASQAAASEAPRGATATKAPPTAATGVPEHCRTAVKEEPNRARSTAVVIKEEPDEDCVALGVRTGTFSASGRTASWMVPSADDIIGVCLTLEGKTKKVRHAAATKVGDLLEQYQRGRNLVVKDSAGFEIGRELTLGLLAENSPRGPDGGVVLDLHLETDDW